MEDLEIMKGVLGVFDRKDDLTNVIDKLFTSLRGIIDFDIGGVYIRNEGVPELIVWTEGVNVKTQKEIIRYLTKKIEGIERKEIDLSECLVTFLSPKGKCKRKKKKCQGFKWVPVSKTGIFFLVGSKKISREQKLLLEFCCNQLNLAIELDRLSKQLMEERNKVESLLYGISNGIVVTDMDGKFLEMNGKTKEILECKTLRRGRYFYECLRDVKLIRYFKSVKKLEEGKTVEIEFQSSLIPYLKKVVTITFKIFKDFLGNKKGIIYIITDTTQEREIERLKSELIAITSHELRTPLAAIREAIALVMEGFGEEITPLQQRFLNIARRNVDRLNTTITQLLDLSRIEEDRLRLLIESVDLGALIREVFASMNFMVEEKSLTLGMEVEEHIPVRGDAERIRQILVNLLSNAIKYTPEGGKISIKTTSILDSCLGQMVCIEIRDTGVGIPKEKARYVFSKFQQLEPSLTRSAGGLGLGLALSKRLVELQGGKIWFESEVGKGTSFYFTLPAVR